DPPRFGPPEGERSRPLQRARPAVHTPARPAVHTPRRTRRGDGAVRTREPEEGPAGAVALAEAVPGAGGDGQAQVGRLGPGAEGDQDRAPLAGPGGEAAGL